MKNEMKINSMLKISHRYLIVNDIQIITWNRKKDRIKKEKTLNRAYINIQRENRPRNEQKTPNNKNQNLATSYFFIWIFACTFLYIFDGSLLIFLLCGSVSIISFSHRFIIDSVVVDFKHTYIYPHQYSI